MSGPTPKSTIEKAIEEALKSGADILVVGRAITASMDVHHAAEEFLEPLNEEEIDQFRIMTDF